ncbi:hypothetical protein GCM10010275_69360 [Streptomyces litmocidini]|nr:hypothetical protein GCM10010275_69360 [Streptomyces litmocidini]
MPIRYEGPAIVLMDGTEVPVLASLVITIDPSTVEDFTHDRMNAWAGSLQTDADVDLFDAAPGILRLPDGAEGEFMATSGPANHVGISGLGPAPFG